MGEEFSASAPFQFFVDFSDDPALSAAVRDGRRREFAHFKSFAEQHGERQVPDPTLEETFARSRPDWDEAARPPHADVRRDTGALMRLRHDEVVPLTQSGFVGAAYSLPQAGRLDVTWRFERGRLRFLANFGAAEAFVDIGAAERVLWASPDLVPGPGRVRLRPWTGLFLKDVS